MNLKFWKTEKPIPPEKDFGFSKADDLGLGISHEPDFSSQSFSPIPQRAQPSFPPQHQAPEAFSSHQSYQQQSSIEKDLQLINSKLDVIKMQLDNLNQRLLALEKIAKGETEAEPSSGYGKYGRF